MATLTVIAKITAKPGQEEKVQQGLQNMLAPSRQEEGCLRYDVFQSNDDPAVFYTHEEWTAKNALDQHTQTPHFKNWMPRASKLWQSLWRSPCCLR